MMGLRRYLTSRYDWTGISRWFYTSKIFEIAAILLVAALVGLGFYLFHGPMLTDRVALNVFAPNTTIEILDIILLVILSALLLSNAWRLFKGVMGDPDQYPKPSSQCPSRHGGIAQRSPKGGGHRPLHPGSEGIRGPVFHPETVCRLR